MINKTVPMFPSLFRIDAWYEQNLVQVTNMMEYTIQFLLMELESVGNIRLEEGCSTDPWYYSTITFINIFTVVQDKTHCSFVMYPTGLLPVAISCCPASLVQTLWFMASLGLRSIELSASTTAL